MYNFHHTRIYILLSMILIYIVIVIVVLTTLKSELSDASLISIFMSLTGALFAIIYENLRYTNLKNTNNIKISIEGIDEMFFESMILQQREGVLFAVELQSVDTLETFQQFKNSWMEIEEGKEGDFLHTKIINNDNDWFIIRLNKNKEETTLPPGGNVIIISKGKVKITLRKRVRGSTKRVYYGF